MECRVVDRLLDEYLDNRLAPDEAEAVARHLKSCTPCRDLACELRRVAAGIRLLPREMEPPEQVWDRILAEIGEQERGRLLSGRFGPARRTLIGVVLAVAAALVLVVATVVVVRQSPVPGNTTARHDGVPSRVVPAALKEAGFDDEMAGVRAELRAVLASRRGALAPETIAVVDENLAIIEWALEEIEQAMEVDPGNRQLVHLLVATYQQEIDLLSRVSLEPAA